MGYEFARNPFCFGGSLCSRLGFASCPLGATATSRLVSAWNSRLPPGSSRRQIACWCRLRQERPPRAVHTLEKRTRPCPFRGSICPLQEMRDGGGYGSFPHSRWQSWNRSGVGAIEVIGTDAPFSFTQRQFHPAFATRLPAEYHTGKGCRCCTRCGNHSLLTHMRRAAISLPDHIHAELDVHVPSALYERYDHYLSGRSLRIEPDLQISIYDHDASPRERKGGRERPPPFCSCWSTFGRLMLPDCCVVGMAGLRDRCNVSIAVLKDGSCITRGKRSAVPMLHD